MTGAGSLPLRLLRRHPALLMRFLVMVTQEPLLFALSVAHRLSTVRTAARILVRDNGWAVGLRSHETLLAGWGTYRRLWSAQAGDAEEVAERAR